MRVLCEKVQNGQTYYHILCTESDNFMQEFKTIDQIENKSIISQYLNNRNQQQNEGSLSFPRIEEFNQMTKEDQLFFSQFRNSGVNFPPDLNVDSVIPVTTPSCEIKIMIPCNNDYVFVTPSNIEQINNEKYKVIYDRLINHDQNLDSDDGF